MLTVTRSLFSWRLRPRIHFIRRELVKKSLFAPLEPFTLHAAVACLHGPINPFRFRVPSWGRMKGTTFNRSEWLGLAIESSTPRSGLIWPEKNPTKQCSVHARPIRIGMSFMLAIMKVVLGVRLAAPTDAYTY